MGHNVMDTWVKKIGVLALVMVSGSVLATAFSFDPGKKIVGGTEYQYTQQQISCREKEDDGVWVDLDSCTDENSCKYTFLVYGAGDSYRITSDSATLCLGGTCDYTITIPQAMMPIDIPFRGPDDYSDLSGQVEEQSFTTTDNILHVHMKAWLYSL